MSTVAVAWLAVTIAPSDSRGLVVGSAIAAYTLPGAVGAVVLARWARRRTASRLLVLDSSLRAGFLAVIPLAHAVGTLQPALYVALLAASSLLHAWGKAGKHALLPSLVAADQRLAANAVLSASGWGSIILGPALAGLLTAHVSPAYVIGFDALTFGALALRVATTRAPKHTSCVSRPPIEGARTARRLLTARPDLFGLLSMTWFFNAFFGPVEVALPLFVVNDLDGGAGKVATYWATFGIGAVVGVLALGTVRRLRLWPVMLGIVAGHGFGMLPFVVSASWVPSLVGFTLAGAIYGPYSALSFTYVQERAPAESLTTVLAARSAVLLTASPIGAAAAGPLLNVVNARTILVGSGVAMILLAVLATLALQTVRLSRARTRADAALGRTDDYPSHVVEASSNICASPSK